MRCTARRICSAVLCLGAFIWSASAQQATPTPPDDTVRIPTEEVQLTVRAEGAYPGFTPKLRMTDITLLEDGVEQTITSMKSVPARVAVVIDTGAALTFAKTREVTRMTARTVIASLPESTVFTVIQYGDVAETIVSWTDVRPEAAVELDSKLRTGKRSIVADGLRLALRSFASQPAENRHLILVTDGLNGGFAFDPSSLEARQIAAANITVHVLSYTAIEQDGAEDASKTVRINSRLSKPRVPKEIFEDMIRALPVPVEVKAYLKTMNEAQQIVVIDLDRERRKMLKRRREEWGKGEQGMKELASVTGGGVSVPTGPVEFLVAASDIAKSIGSHYSITYTPATSIKGSSAPRVVTLRSNSESIKLRTRKTVIAQP